MTDTLINPPRTIMEVFRMLPEGTLAEVIDNQLYMSPTPTAAHQRISRKLTTQLDQYVTEHQLGEIFYAPLDVVLDKSSNAVQPDIIFVAKRNSKIIQDDGNIMGAPDLIIEILSPGNKKHDLIVKKSLYEKFGVQEYWVVDPKTKLATGFTLLEKAYTILAEDSTSLTSKLLQKTFSIT